MKLENLKQIIFKDSYIDIAIKEYLKFEESKYDNKKNKEKILRELNYEIKDKKITSENIVNVIELFKNKNPQTGSFVHWNNLDDLMKYAEEKPVEVAGLFNNLYEESVPLGDKIKEFYEKGKEYKSTIRLSTSLFGYLLAGLDREKYPLYKEEIFRDFLRTFTINESISDITVKYTTYYEICNLLKEYFKEKGYIKNPTMIDMEDFIYCISQYKELYVKISVIYLNNHCKKLNEFKEDDKKFLEFIVSLDKEYLNKILAKYVDNEKINLIRYRVCEKVLKDRTIDLFELEKIKREISGRYNQDILKAWNNFRILFPFYYEQYKEKVNIELRKIYKTIFEIEEFKDIKFKRDKYISDLSGPFNYGTDCCWLVIYPDNKASHKEAAQLYIGIFPEKVEYGLGFGDNLEYKEKISDRVEILRDINEFSYEKMRKKLINIFDMFKTINYPELNDSVNKEIHKNENDKNNDNIYDKKDMFIIPSVSFDIDLKVNNLYFEDKEIILRQVSTALKSGKHIILVGPPGTGKSKLAKEICKNYNVKYIMATATSDWSTYETIGGYKLNDDNKLYFDEGIFLKAIKDKNGNTPINKWLIIDEINRADIDKAFGALFSALTGDEVTLSFKAESQNNLVIRLQREDEEEIKGTDYEYVIPKDWRIIGTMNTYDKASLYEMSYAFMRRFAFIPIMVPKKTDKDLIREYLNIWNIEDRNINEINLEVGLAEIWHIINKYRKVGPAIIEDIARYVSEQGDYTSAIILYVLPQFEGLMEETIIKFVKDLYSSNIKDFIQNKRLLDNFVKDFFGIKIIQESRNEN